MRETPIWRRYLRLLGSDPSADVEDELRFHLETRVEDLVRSGLPEPEARSRAEREFGDLERIRGEMNEIGRARQRRESRASGWESLRQDVRFAARTLGKSPGFTLVASLTLALGIGASTGMFMLVDAVLLRPLPYAEPERLVALWERPPHAPEMDNQPSPANVAVWRERATSFAAIASYVDGRASLTGGGDAPAEEVLARYASPNWFQTLGAPARQGRTFAADDGEPPVAVLSHRLWQRRFAGAADVVGRTLLLNQEPYTVVGVMPPDFRPIGGDAPDLWIPSDPAPEQRGRFLRVVARLAPGVDLERARTEMRALAAQTAVEAPQFNEGWSADAVPLREQEVGDVRPALLVLMGAVGLLLLIACGNLANLLLGRATARTREMAVRLSLGASRGRLLRQTLTEALVLAAIGGALGIALAVGIVQLLTGLDPAALDLPRLQEAGLDARVAAFAVGVSFLTAAVFGAAPALAASGVRLAETLRSGTRGSTEAQGLLRRALVVTQVALAVILLAGAGLLARSVAHLVRTDLGLREERVLTLRVPLIGRRGDELRQFVGALLPRLEAIPGVTAAAATSWLPLTSGGSSTVFFVAGRPQPATGQEPGGDVRVVTPGYHAALGVPVLRGRAFDARDHAGAPRVFVINQALAEAVFPGEDPLGRRLLVPWNEMLDGEIVGVVGDVRHAGPDQPPRPAMYWAYDQMPAAVVNVVLATRGDPAGVASSAVAAVHELDPAVPVGSIRPMEDVVAASLARPRFYMAVLAGFAAASLLLAAVGLFGVISYSVALKRRAIGVRMALGATAGAVTRLVVREGMVLTLAGLVVGIAAAAALTRVLRGLLHGVSPTDPLTAAAVSVFLLAVALVASWLPARRAARVDPTETMRPE